MLLIIYYQIQDWYINKYTLYCDRQLDRRTCFVIISSLPSHYFIIFLFITSSFVIGESENESITLQLNDTHNFIMILQVFFANNIGLVPIVPDKMVPVTSFSIQNCSYLFSSHTLYIIQFLFHTDSDNVKIIKIKCFLQNLNYEC